MLKNEREVGEKKKVKGLCVPVSIVIEKEAYFLPTFSTYYHDHHVQKQAKQ